MNELKFQRTSVSAGPLDLKVIWGRVQCVGGGEGVRM
jgi:hypothetical protein